LWGKLIPKNHPTGAAQQTPRCPNKRNYFGLPPETETPGVCVSQMCWKPVRGNNPPSTPLHQWEADYEAGSVRLPVEGFYITSTATNQIFGDVETETVAAVFR
jgi:hypothetical protein